MTKIRQQPSSLPHLEIAKQAATTQVIQAAPANKPQTDFKQGIRNVGSVKGFYWGTNPAEIPHDHMEEFLGVIEGSR